MLYKHRIMIKYTDITYKMLYDMSEEDYDKLTKTNTRKIKKFINNTYTLCQFQYDETEYKCITIDNMCQAFDMGWCRQNNRPAFWIKSIHYDTMDIAGDVIKVKSKKLNRSTQNQGYISKFVGFLTYKAEKIGKRVIEISEVNTTKRCYVCGKMHNMTLSDRIMKCAIGSDGLPCGNIIDRDRNSAINIMINFLLENNLKKNMRRFIQNLGRESLLVPIWIKI